MRKNRRDSIREQEDEDALPASIIAVVATSVNALWPSEQSASVWSDASFARASRCREQQGLPKSVRLVTLVLEQQEQTVFQRLREWYRGPDIFCPQNPR